MIDANIAYADDAPPPPHVNPNGSVWVVAVAEDGVVHVLQSPSFNDDGRYGEIAEELFETDLSDDPAGVYKWICNLSTYTDTETGRCWHFFPIHKHLLYTWENHARRNTNT